MPRSYLNAFPDVRGQQYERTVFAETQASPIETAADIYGITGSVISSSEDGTVVTPMVRRYRYRLAWNFLPTERAVDIEYAVDLCANGSGAPIPFIEWEVTDETDYVIPAASSMGLPLFYFPLQTIDPVTSNIITPVHWWEVQAFDLWQSDTGDNLSDGWPVATNEFNVPPPTPVYTATVDDTWLGNIPSLRILAGVPDGAPMMLGASVTGRRIRMVTVEPDSYVREKTRQPDMWSVAVTLIEKESGAAPGYPLIGTSDITIGGGP